MPTDTHEIDAFMAHYIALVMFYRAMYVVNWIVRAVYFQHFTMKIVWISGIIQNILLLDLI